MYYRGPSSRLQSYCFTNEIVEKYVDIQQLQVLDYLYKREGYSTGLGPPGSVEDTNVKYFASQLNDCIFNIIGGNLGISVDLDL